jgi:serine phosphatase RsbU (regulator of sigma subunit)
MHRESLGQVVCDFVKIADNGLALGLLDNTAYKIDRTELRIDDSET